MLACSALILTSSGPPLLSPGSLHLGNCDKRTDMTQSVKNRGFTVDFCTCSKEVSEECVEVGGHPCCALYSEKDQHSLFLLNMRRIKYTLVDLSSLFQ